MRRAVYPGSFDPMTNGHLDVMERGSRMFDELIVAVAINTGKSPMFDMNERVGLIKAEVEQYGNVRVEQFEGLAVEFARLHDAAVLLRGIRSVSDFEYELQMAHTNRCLAPDVESLFMLPSVEWSFVSARLLKEALAMGADISHFVSPRVLEAMQQKLEVSKA
ncbi:MAG: pantetheine-phosphate adenylyltransferase [Planctomycetota bacterium]|jgi:pantetheine-phosphate adenylyltransferase